MSGTRRRRRRLTIDGATLAWTIGVLLLVTIGGTGAAPTSDAAPPPAGRFDHGAAGSALNGTGGEIAPSPTSASWPGTANAGNGGAFAFIGAQYGSLWNIPATANNSLGIGYCVMEDVGGTGTVTRQPDPAVWDATSMARAGALMSTFGGDRVVPYGIDASGPYDVPSGEWQQPSLLGGGEYTRRRQVAVNFGVKMFVADVSPSGAAAGRKLARDTSVVNGSDGNFAALRNGYEMAQRMATVAESQHAVDGLRLQIVWGTADGAAPTAPGTHPVEVHAIDFTGKAVGLVPIVQLSDVGIDGMRSVGAVARVNQASDTSDETARWNAAHATGWPTWGMDSRMADDHRFVTALNPLGADVTDIHGVARFDVTIAGPDWELGFHSQAPTDEVDLYAGTGVQGQITWGGTPQSASVHQVSAAPLPPPAPPPPPPLTGTFVIRKSLDHVDVQVGRDMSGFTFDVASAGVSIGRYVTGGDGRTPPIEALPGDYVVAEVARPTWAQGLIGDGPVRFAFDPDDAPGTIEIEYINHESPATITTSARDPLDGDRFIHLGDDESATTIVDSVFYTGLIPGTEYLATGELVVGVDSSDDAARPDLSTTQPTGLVGSTRFTPSAPDGMVEVTITADRVPSLAGQTMVVHQQVAVASSGRVVAVHRDPEAADQTIRFPRVTTTLQLLDANDATPEVGDAVVDVLSYSALEPGRKYRAEMILQHRDDNGICVPTDQVASVEFSTTSSEGVVEVTGARIADIGTQVAFERVYVFDERSPAGQLLIATHEDCDDAAQSVDASAPPRDESSPATTVTTIRVDTSVTTVPMTTGTAPPTLARTGGAPRSEAVAAFALLISGIGILIAARQRQ